MLFALFLNFTPILLGFLISRAMKSGQIPVYLGLLRVSRTQNPLLFILFMMGLSFVFLITISLALYLDFVALQAHLGRV